MPHRPRRLLRGTITYSAAKEDETNILRRLTYVVSAAQFRLHLEHCRDQITTLVTEHMGLRGTESCDVAPIDEWITGSFNICLPVTLKRSASPTQLLIRFPLPYKVGDSFRSGNSDEKLRSEAATYIWMGENCPDIRIPRLWSFGDSRGHSLVVVDNAPLITRCLHYLKKLCLSLFRRPIPSPYVYHPKLHSINAGFLLIERVGGQMLSETWDSRLRFDQWRRKNLFRSLSKIIASMNSVPLSRIGSFTIDNDGFVTLANRPLTLELQQLENEHIPVNIPRDRTYAATESYIMDLLSCHRQRLIYEPNAINDESDCMSQMSALAIMSAVLRHYFPHKEGQESFFLMLTDLHPSNIFVDKDWHITSVIDLEWACTRPLTMQHPPYWLTGASVDTIDIEQYDEVRKEFMKALDEVEIEHRLQTNHTIVSTKNVMQRGWESGNFWYCLALDSITGLHTIFYEYIQPKYAPAHADDANYYRIVSRYFVQKAQQLIMNKLEAKKEYDLQLEAEFATPPLDRVAQSLLAQC